MNPFTAIRDYFRWCRLWSIDYEADDWRIENERCWEGFCRWRRGELPEDMETAVVEAKVAIFFASLTPVFTAFNTAVESVYNAVVQMADAIAPVITSIGNAIISAFYPATQWQAKRHYAIMRICAIGEISEDHAQELIDYEMQRGASFQDAADRVYDRIASGNYARR